MKNDISTKSVAIALSLALAVTAMPMPASAAPAAAMPDFVKTLTPSESLGFVDSYFQGSSERPVILIQDLHANYGVQQKINGLLKFFQPQVAPTGRPMVLGIEGAWGEISLTNIRNKSEKVRQIATDFLLKESEITASSHFAVNAENKVRLVGIDDPNDYIVHVQLFRKSLAARLSLAKKTDQLRLAINDSKLTGPSGLRRLWAIEDAIHAGRMDLNTLSRKLGVEVHNYKEAEEAIAQAKQAELKKSEGQKNVELGNLVEADQNLSLLGRLLRQQLTFEEVQYASKRVPAMLSTVRAFLPNDNLALWGDTIRAAIDYYAVALVRDTPMAKNALDLARANSDSSVVIIAGGFHTAGITRYLKEKRVSHIVIAPVVEAHTAKDEEVYVKRMMDIHVSDAEIASSLPTKAQAQSVPAQDIVVTQQGNQAATLSPARTGLWNRVVTRIEQGASAVEPTVEATDVENGINAVLNVPVVPKGLGARVKAGIRRIAGSESEPIAVEASTENSAADVSVTKPAASSTGTGIGNAKVTAIFGASALAYGTLVQAAQSAANNPVIQQGAQTGDPSSATAWAIGTGVAVAGAAWGLFGNKERRERTNRAIAAARQAVGGAA